MAQWWDEWQLRVLVLASLCAQYLIALCDIVRSRKIYIPPGFRVLFRMAHIGRDALAIFALATLFNRQKDGSGRRHDLEPLWALILVMHLGGQVVITSYKIEDNEQWRRHILTSLSKVTVAAYVFIKSGFLTESRSFDAKFYLFFMVVIRCLEKAFVLKASSFNVLRKERSSSDDDVIFRGTFLSQEEQLNIDGFIKEASTVYRSAYRPCRPWKWDQHVDGTLPHQLFLDVPYPHSYRVEIIRSFCPLDPKSAYRAMGDELYAMTSVLYTKDNCCLSSVRFCLYMLTIGAVYPTLIITIWRVHTCYTGESTRVTLVLLYGTLLLELVFSMQPAFRAGKYSSGRILQHNLIKVLAHDKWGSRLRRIAGWSQCFWHMEPSDSCVEITELVLRHVESAWKDYICCPVSYKKFNDIRGDRTLAKNGCLGQLGSSIRRPFGESIILWHLATDLCFHQKAVSPDDGDQCARRCKVMSNYMMHLLFENPEMLLPGTRKSLFRKAYEQLKDNLKSERTPLAEREIAQKIIEKGEAGIITGSLIKDAWKLAKSLLDYSGDHGDETRMWKVIQGVWVEMLCFSAGRCRGYLHAEALGTGAEYLSYVWVLLAYSGMEIFPDKLQREGLSFDSDDPPVQHGREDGAATAFAPESESSAHVGIQVGARAHSF